MCIEIITNGQKSFCFQNVGKIKGQDKYDEIYQWDTFIKLKTQVQIVIFSIVILMCSQQLELYSNADIHFNSSVLYFNCT